MEPESSRAQRNYFRRAQGERGTELVYCLYWVYVRLRLPAADNRLRAAETVSDVFFPMAGGSFFHHWSQLFQRFPYPPSRCHHCASCTL